MKIHRILLITFFISLCITSCINAESEESEVHFYEQKEAWYFLENQRLVETNSITQLTSRDVNWVEWTQSSFISVVSFSEDLILLAVNKTGILSLGIDSLNIPKINRQSLTSHEKFRDLTFGASFFMNNRLYVGTFYDNIFGKQMDSDESGKYYIFQFDEKTLLPVKNKEWENLEIISASESKTGNKVLFNLFCRSSDNGGDKKYFERPVILNDDKTFIMDNSNQTIPEPVPTGNQSISPEYSFSLSARQTEILQTENSVNIAGNYTDIQNLEQSGVLPALPENCYWIWVAQSEDYIFAVWSQKIKFLTGHTGIFIKKHL